MRITLLVIVCLAALTAVSGVSPAGGTDHHNIVATTPCPAGLAEQEPFAALTLTAEQHDCLPARGAAEANTAGVAPGSIAGTITEEGSGAPLPGACAIAYQEAFGGPAGLAFAGADGGYLIESVPPGDYVVELAPCNAPGFHHNRWYNGRETIGTADTVTVAAGAAVTGIDAALPAGGGAISGEVIEDGNGLALPFVCAVAFDSSGTLSGLGVSNASGAFSIGGLASGAHRVAFVDCLPGGAHVIEWYDNQLNGLQATVLNVTEGQKTGGLAVSLALGASVNGHVVQANNNADLPDICVEIYDQAGFFRGSARTDAAGTYTVNGLPQLGVKVVFFDCVSPLFHVAEWYRDRNDFASATVVNMGGPGSKRSGIDGTLQLGGSLTGTIRSQGQPQEPIEDICIQAFGVDGSVRGFGFTDADGRFEVGGLISSIYSLRVRDCRAEPEFASLWAPTYDLPAFEEPPVHAVAAGQASDIGVVKMRRGGLVSGRVTDRAGTDAVLACVQVYAANLPFRQVVDFLVTDLDGGYSVPLLGGNYRILFFDCSREQRYVHEWYRDKLFFDTADIVNIVSASTTRSGINGTLALAIAGDVDCSGVVTSIDAAVILQATAFLIDEMPCQQNSDVDGDGFFSAVDAALVLQFVARLVDRLPV